MKSEKTKTKVYECANYLYEYDDLGKYAWCRSSRSGKRECDCNYIYAMQFCPFFEKGNLRGTWEISAAEKDFAEEFKRKLENDRIKNEIAERALYEHLRKKYG